MFFSIESLLNIPALNGLILKYKQQCEKIVGKFFYELWNDGNGK